MNLQENVQIWDILNWNSLLPEEYSSFMLNETTEISQTEHCNCKLAGDFMQRNLNELLYDRRKSSTDYL